MFDEKTGHEKSRDTVPLNSINNIYSNVWDKTTSLVYVDRVSMHIVEHHDDLFFWKKFNNYRHVNIV